VFVGLDTGLWQLRAIMLGRGICMAFAFVPMQAATYANITPTDAGRASAIFSTQRQVAAALGVAALGTVLLSRIHAANTGVTDPGALAHGTLSGYHVAVLVGSLLVVLAAASGLLIRDKDALIRDKDAASTCAPVEPGQPRAPVATPSTTLPKTRGLRGAGLSANTLILRRRS
jgi:hypothetical protein